MDAAVSDGLKVRNVTVQVRHDSGTWGTLRTVITDPDGSGVVQGFRALDGGDWTANTPGDRLWRGPTSIICNSHNKGTITFKDCQLGGFPDNGLYAANGSGKVIVDGGLYKNSQTASVRIGGRNSVVKNAKMVVDESNGRGNQHALRVENSNYVRVQNCDIEVSDPNGDAIKTMNVGLFRLEDSNVTTSGDEVVHGLRIQSKTEMARIKRSTFVHDAPGGFSVLIEDGPKPVYLEDTAFTGAGGHESARAAIRCDRDDCEFRNLDVEQSGSWRRRAIELHSDDCLIYDGRYVGRMTPLLNYGSNTWVESTYAESVDYDEAVRLYDTGSGVYLKKNTLVNGIDDRACEGLRLYDNSY